MAQFLREQGYDAYALRGGLGAWLDAGYPAEPKTSERQPAAGAVCPDCGQPLHTHRTARRSA